jgi:Ca-activated chloride channel family protein
VSLTRKADDQAFTIPMTLTIGVQGAAGTGKPEYVDGATPVAGDSVTPSVTPTDEPPTPSDDKTEAGGPVKDNGGADEGGTPYGLIGGLGGGALVLLLLGVWAVLRLQKKPAVAQPQYASTQYASPQQYPGEQPQQHPGQQPPQYPNQGPPLQ